MSIFCINVTAQKMVKVWGLSRSTLYGRHDIFKMFSVMKALVRRINLSILVYVRSEILVTGLEFE